MSNTQITKAERDAMIAKVVAEVEAKVSRLEKLAPVRPDQAALEAVMKQAVALHDRLVEVEIEQGLRTARPVRKRNATLTEQFRAIAADLTVRKGGNNGSTISWRNLL